MLGDFELCSFSAMRNSFWLHHCFCTKLKSDCQWWEWFSLSFTGGSQPSKLAAVIKRGIFLVLRTHISGGKDTSEGLMQEERWPHQYRSAQAAQSQKTAAWLPNSLFIWTYTSPQPQFYQIGITVFKFWVLFSWFWDFCSYGLYLRPVHTHICTVVIF